ncbi:hypothetical protein ACNF49_24460 [Actinomadura sp. ATCC 39365]|uniref:hypothetical protein n=1 Tax=Nonomuraea sp. NPDC005692 TaxID=3157168 RepID=UPI0033DEFEFE
MRGRVLVRGGAAVAVAALAGLGVYFSKVGLEEADRLASVIGLFVAVAGLGLAVYGLIAERRSGGDGVEQRATAMGDGRVHQAGRDINDTPPERTAAGDAGDEARSVRQRAKATGRGQVYQAGRDIDKR